MKYFKNIYVWSVIMVLIISLLLSGCATTNVVSAPPKQDQLILVVPNELLQPISPLQIVTPKEENERTNHQSSS